MVGFAYYTIPWQPINVKTCRCNKEQAVFNAHVNKVLVGIQLNWLDPEPL